MQEKLFTKPAIAPEVKSGKTCLDEIQKQNYNLLKNFNQSSIIFFKLESTGLNLIT
jgi:hypothetical protein